MSLSTFKNVKVAGMVTVVPEHHINIDDEIEFYENSRKKLERNKKILGLGTRHIVEDGTTMFELCEEAANILIDEMKLDKQEIDTIIFASINHDYNGNADACILQGNLGLSEETACIDTSGLGCTDIPYGIWLGHSLVQSRASKKCLFVEGSLSSQITDKRNRNSNMLFGDGGAAVLLEYSDTESPSYFHMMSRGAEWKSIVTPAGGFRFPVREDITDIELEDATGNPLRLWDSVMDGNAVFRFAIQAAPHSINTLLNFADKTKDDIDFFAIHQANGQIVKTIINHGEIPKDKASSRTFTTFGNCGGTSVLMNLCHEAEGKTMDDVLMVSFGVGLSTASCILNIKDTFNGGVRMFKTPPSQKSRKALIDEWSTFITDGAK